MDETADMLSEERENTHDGISVFGARPCRRTVARHVTSSLCYKGPFDR